MYKIPIDHNMQFKKNSLRNVLVDSKYIVSDHNTSFAK